MPAKKKVGLIAGVFDMVHAGHVLALREAKEQCDYLIVALHNAPIEPSKNQPVMSSLERAIMLRACRYVDDVFYYDTEHKLIEMLVALAVDIRFLGDDYRSRAITGSDLPIETRFLRRDHGWSSSALRARAYAAEVMRLGGVREAHAVR